MHGLRNLVAVTTLALVSGALSGQVGSRDSGTTPIGSRGYDWQTEQQLAKEAMAQLEAQFERMSQEEWLQQALAWLAFDRTEEGQIAVDESFRVTDIDAGKKAEVTLIDDDPMTWEIGYPKKAPKELNLTLSDQGSTQIKCDFSGSAREMSKGYLGVFQHEGRLFCLPRAASAEAAS